MKIIGFWLLIQMAMYSTHDKDSKFREIFPLQKTSRLTGMHVSSLQKRTTIFKTDAHSLCIGYMCINESSLKIPRIYGSTLTNGSSYFIQTR